MYNPSVCMCLPACVWLFWTCFPTNTDSTKLGTNERLHHCPPFPAFTKLDKHNCTTGIDCLQTQHTECLVRWKMLQISSQPRLEVRMENVRVNTKETLVDDFDSLRMRLQEVRESQGISNLQFARPRVVDHLRLDLCTGHLYG